MRERLLIVNADDLGWTRGVNHGVFEAHEKGVVSSATLMDNAAAAEDAAALAPRHPGLGIGLHVVLTGAGRPSLPAARVPSLVDADGRLPRRPEGLREPDPGEVRAEIEAQVERFHELLGRAPSHLDGHHHVHRHPVVGEAVALVAGERGLPVRRASPEVGERLRAAGVATTDEFIERFDGEGARLEVLLEILRGLAPGVTEVMCHPARVDPELRRTSTYVEDREVELAVLTDPEARRVLAAENVRLVDFGAL